MNKLNLNLNNKELKSNKSKNFVDASYVQKTKIATNANPSIDRISLNKQIKSVENVKKQLNFQNERKDINPISHFWIMNFPVTKKNTYVEKHRNHKTYPSTSTSTSASHHIYQRKRQAMGGSCTRLKWNSATMLPNTTLNKLSVISHGLSILETLPNDKINKKIYMQKNKVHVSDSKVVKQEDNTYLIRIQPLEAINLDSPCNPNICSHLIEPIIQIEIGNIKKRTKCASMISHSIVWRNEKTPSILEFSICSRDSKDMDNIHNAQIKVFNRCNKKNILLGKIPINIGQIFIDAIQNNENLDEIKTCNFYPLYRFQSKSLKNFSMDTPKIKLLISIIPIFSKTNDITNLVMNKVEEKFEEKKEVIAKPAIHYNPEIKDEKKINLVPNLSFSLNQDILNNKKNRLKHVEKKKDIENKQIHSIEMENEIQKSKDLFTEIHTNAKSKNHLVNDLNTIEKGDLIGEGIYANVYHGKMTERNDDLTKTSPMKEVAIKEYRYSRSPPPLHVLEVFYQEYLLLAAHKHVHLLEFIGIIFKNDHMISLITEYMNSGSLYQFMRNEDKWKNVSISKRIQISVEIARAISFLHSHNIVHRDIKSHNIMIKYDTEKNELVAKLGDMGSAIILSKNDNLIYQEIGTLGYTAPEIFIGKGYDKSVDIWSLGILMWEIMNSDNLNDKDEMTYLNPFLGIPSTEFIQIASQNVRPTFHPTIEEKLPFEYKTIVHSCWEFNANNRPKIDYIVKTLEDLISIY